MSKEVGYENERFRITAILVGVVQILSPTQPFSSRHATLLPKERWVTREKRLRRRLFRIRIILSFKLFFFFQVLIGLGL